MSSVARCNAALLEYWEHLLDFNDNIKKNHTNLYHESIFEKQTMPGHSADMCFLCLRHLMPDHAPPRQRTP